MYVCLCIYIIHICIYIDICSYRICLNTYMYRYACITSTFICRTLFCSFFLQNPARSWAQSLQLQIFGVSTNRRPGSRPKHTMTLIVRSQQGPDCFGISHMRNMAPQFWWFLVPPICRNRRRGKKKVLQPCMGPYPEVPRAIRGPLRPYFEAVILRAPDW